MVPRARYLAPRDLRFGHSEFGAEGLHGFADLDEPHADRVQNESVLEVAAEQVGADGVNRRRDVL